MHLFVLPTACNCHGQCRLLAMPKPRRLVRAWSFLYMIYVFVRLYVWGFLACSLSCEVCILARSAFSIRLFGCKIHSIHIILLVFHKCLNTYAHFFGGKSLWKNSNWQSNPLHNLCSMCMYVFLWSIALMLYKKFLMQFFCSKVSSCFLYLCAILLYIYFLNNEIQSLASEQSNKT